MKILITNDDGIKAPGIKALALALKKLGKVTVVAPETEQSAVGHGISLYNPLLVKKHELFDGIESYSVSGTPADCVKVGITGILDFTPDLVVSGINNGYNIGINNFYSGTVAGAREGRVLGIPSVAVSIKAGSAPRFDTAAQVAQRLLKDIDISAIPEKEILNINVPDLEYNDIKGIKITTMGMCSFIPRPIKRQDPRGNDYYWMAGFPPEDIEQGTDFEAVTQGFVSITPMTWELTAHTSMEALDKLDLSL
jgi:5'-nucleotidase